MRLTAMAISGLVVLAAIGCEPPPTEQLAFHFTKALNRHFDKLNNEAYERQEDLEKMKMLHERNPGFPKPTGTTFSTYYWDVNVRLVQATDESGTPLADNEGKPIMVPGADAEGNPIIDQGLIVQDLPCQIPGCGTKLLFTVPPTVKPTPAPPYLCPSCGHSPYDQNHDPDKLKESPCELCVGNDLQPNEPSAEQISVETLGLFEGTKVKPMFQLTQTDPKAGPLAAVVRYVRRTWHYDPRGTVKASEAALQNAGGVGREWLPSPDGTDHSAPGFHRLDSTFVGEVQYVFEGGQLKQAGKATETPVRPWKDIRIPK